MTNLAKFSLVNESNMKHYLQRLRSLDRPTPTSWFSFAAFTIVAASVGVALATGAFTPQLDTSPVAGLAWEAESGSIESPFRTHDGYVYQRRGTSLSEGGRAMYSFTLNESGEYVIKGMVDAAHSGANSFYVNVDSTPSRRNVWHIPLTNGFEEREVTWRENQHTFNLGAGDHTIVVVGREGDTRLDRLWLERVGGDEQQEPDPTDPPAEETQAPTEDPTDPPAEATDPPADPTDPPAEETPEPDPPQQSAPAAPGALAWEAEAGEIIAPMVASDGVVYQPEKTSRRSAGRAVYHFTTSGAGEFLVHTIVDAPNSGQNSFYVAIDSDPGRRDTWHISETSGYQERVVTAGNKSERVFTLGAGDHSLIFLGREANTRLDRVWIEQIGGDSALESIEQQPVETLAPTEEPAATDAPASGISAPIFVNAGNCGPVDWSGYTWLGDQGYSGGNWGHVGSDYQSVDSTIAGPVVDTNGNLYGDSGQYVYRCQVYGTDFGYHFDLPNGEYTVTLYFAEPVWSSAGERLFDVVAEGGQVYDNLDVAAEAGGDSIAIARSFTVNVADGNLTVDFVGNQGGSSDSNAFLNAMSVVAGSSAPSVGGGTTAPTPEPTAGPTAEPTPEPTAEPAPVVEPGQTLYYADVETGDLSQWTGDRSPQTGWRLGGVWLSGSAQASASRDYAHSGSYSVALTVDGSGGARMARRGLPDNPSLPDDAYYSAWYYFPYTFDVHQFNNVFQWKRAFDNTSQPVYSVNIYNRSDGSLYFLLNDKVGDDGGYKTSGWGNQASASINIPIGQWVHLECRFRWSTNPDGQVQCWQDGVELWNIQNVITDLDKGDIEHPRQWAVNNYSNGMDPSRVTFYIDDAAISTSRLGPGS